MSILDYDSMEETAAFLRSLGVIDPEVGIILGSGLGRLAEDIEVEQSIDYARIPNFPVSTVEFHKGKLIYGMLSGRKVLAMQGRFHYYEGYSLQQITFPVRVLKLLGIKYLLVSNAGGAMNLKFKKGNLMLIDDHINLLPGTPLIGQNHDHFGTRFPDMSRPYSPSINHKMEEIAAREKITLHKGVYVAVPGPNMETRAEYRYLRNIGADVVGMSTVPEVIVANHMSLPVAAVSVITDECNPDALEPFDINDILETAARAEKNLVVLFKKLIAAL